MSDINRPTKVSVCIVTYNQERYIRECLQSLVDQEADFEFELIVSDDCSTDNTRTIILEYSAKYPLLVKPILHEKNMGAIKNFVFVHEKAQSEFVAHMDGDDYALPGKLQSQVDILSKNSECTAVWHRVDYFDDAGGFCSGKTADLSVFKCGKITFADSIRLGFVGVHSSLMYRRASRTPVDSDKRILDLYIFWDLLSKGNGYFIDDVLGRYRIGASGSMTMGSLRQMKLLAIDHARHFLSKFPEETKNFFLWAVCNVIVDAKNARRTTFDFLDLAWRTRSWVSPEEILSNLRRMRAVQVQWRQQRQSSLQHPGAEVS